MTIPTDVEFADQVTVISEAWLDGINDWVYGSYGVFGATYTPTAFRTALAAAPAVGNAAQTFLAGNSTAATQQVVPRAQADTLYSTLGMGQTWQSPAGRALGVTYQNTTGKPILVSVVITASAVGVNLALVLGVDALVISQQVVLTTTSNPQRLNVIGYIPPDSFYYVDGTGTLLTYYELR